MAKTPQVYYDGQQIHVYSTDNLQLTKIYAATDGLHFDGGDLGVNIDAGDNLTFKGSAHIIGGTNSAIAIGNSGDTINMNVSGVTYSLGNTSGVLALGGTVTLTGNLRIYSNSIADLMRLSVEGLNGRLLSVQDDLSGVLMSVNDSSGLPIMEVNISDRITMGTYLQNTLVVDGTKVGIGKIPATYKLDVNGTIGSTSTITAVTFTDGYISWGAAQLNRYGSAIELQYTPTASSLVRIGANGSNPISMDAVNGTISARQFTSNIATGAPLVITSATVVTNLNADLWDGYQFASYLNQAVLTSSSPAFANVYAGTLGTNTVANTYLRANSTSYITLYENATGRNMIGLNWKVITQGVFWPNAYDGTRPIIGNAFLNAGDVLVNLIQRGGTAESNYGLGGVATAEFYRTGYNSASNITGGSGGIGYAANDTFNITGGYNNAIGIVVVQSGGVVTAWRLQSSFATGYSGVCDTTNIIGSGSGLRVNFTSCVGAHGTGYSVNDVLTLVGGDNCAQITVNTINGSGAVLTFTITAPGAGYTFGNYATTYGGAGTGCQIYVRTLTAGALTPTSGGTNLTAGTPFRTPSSAVISWSNVSTNAPSILITLPAFTNLYRLLLVPSGRNCMPLTYKVEVYSNVGASANYYGFDRWIVAGTFTDTVADAYIKLMQIASNTENIEKLRITVYTAGDNDYANTFALQTIVGYERYIGTGRFQGYNMSASGDIVYGNYIFIGSDATSSNYVLSLKDSAGVKIATFQNDGKLAIGNITPTARLDVAATTGTGCMDEARLGRITFCHPAGGYGQFGEGYYMSNQTPIYRFTDTAARIDFASGNIALETAPSGTQGNSVTFTRRIFIQQSTGRIGFGTNSPATALDVVGAITASTYFATNSLVINGTSSKIYLSNTENGGIDFSTDLTTNGANPLKIYSGNVTKNDGYIAFLQAGVEKMRIHTNGYVGINTVAPTFPLEVTGVLKITSGTLAMGGGEVTSCGGLKFNNGDKITQNDPTTYDMSFYTGSPLTNRMTITATGKVGIGVGAPAAQQEILAITEQLRLSYDNTHNTSFTVSSTGSLSISNSANSVTVAGDFYATAKHFRIPDQASPDHTITYSSLEGPENAVFYRGKIRTSDNYFIIALPKEWKWLVDSQSVSVYLSAEEFVQNLTYELSPGRITIRNMKLFGRGMKCSYLIMATRSDIKKLEVYT